MHIAGQQGALGGCALASNDGVGVDGLGVGLGGLLGREEGVAPTARQPTEDARLDKRAGVVVAVEAKQGDDGGSDLRSPRHKQVSDRRGASSERVAERRGRLPLVPRLSWGDDDRQVWESWRGGGAPSGVPDGGRGPRLPVLLHMHVSHKVQVADALQPALRCEAVQAWADGGPSTPGRRRRLHRSGCRRERSGTSQWHAPQTQPPGH